jgi:uroporphyrinogen III methyltransferase / synthase
VTETGGIVYLVGAGPGNGDYLTVRSRQLLAEAEAIVYDALIDESLLQLAPAGCQRIHVGKRGGQPSWQQADIDRLLVTQCQQGKRVVRLKSGDPFIFGRCTEEIQALKAARCPYEVIPGISSALAGPLLAGIPLTDPVMSHSFTVVTGHDCDRLDWETLARIPTLVILMGTRQLDEILRQLQQHGKSSQTPIAIIRACGTSRQVVWTGTFFDIGDRTRGESLSPAVIVIGEVVKLRDYLLPESASRRQPYPDSFVSPYPVSMSNSPSFAKSSPTPALPLTGKTVLVTRSAGQSSTFTQMLTDAGATAIEMPALEIRPPSSWQSLDSAIARITEFDWLILTSANAVDYFCDRLLAKGKDTRILAGVKIAVVGKKTANTLQQRSLQADYIPPDFVADSLIQEFPDPVAGQKILFPRVETGGREVLVAEFTQQGAIVEEVAAYESGCPEAIAPEAWNALEQRRIDIITFASSKTVRNFCQLLDRKSRSGDRPWQSLLQNVRIASIGPQTSKTCYERLGRVDVEAQEYTLDGLLEALISGNS